MMISFKWHYKLPDYFSFTESSIFQLDANILHQAFWYLHVYVHIFMFSTCTERAMSLLGMPVLFKKAAYQIYVFAVHECGTRYG